MIVVVIVVVVLAVIAAAVYLPKAAGRASAKAGERLEGLDIQRQERGHLLGYASKERAIRGLGLLALTPDELVFSQFVVDTFLRIPRRAIVAVEVVDTFLEKAPGRPVLQVEWADGEEGDTVAFDIPDAQGWAAALR